MHFYVHFRLWLSLSAAPPSLAPTPPLCSLPEQGRIKTVCLKEVERDARGAEVERQRERKRLLFKIYTHLMPLF